MPVLHIQLTNDKMTTTRQNTALTEIRSNYSTYVLALVDKIREDTGGAIRSLRETLTIGITVIAKLRTEGAHGSNTMHASLSKMK